MPRNPETDHLKGAFDQAFFSKQVAYECMMLLGQQCSVLKECVDASWRQISSVRGAMDVAYSRQQIQWEAFRQERDIAFLQIYVATRDADYNDNAEKDCLINIAESMAPPISDFHEYKACYNRLMGCHKVLQSAYQDIKFQHEIAKAEFNQVIEKERAKWSDKSCVECGATMRIHSDWSNSPKYCKECKNKFRKGRESQMNMVNKEIILGTFNEWGTFSEENVRIKPREDDSGKVDVYYSGLCIDGEDIGRRHVVIQEDEIIYVRRPWRDKKDSHAKA